MGLVELRGGWGVCGGGVDPSNLKQKCFRKSYEFPKHGLYSITFFCSEKVPTVMANQPTLPPKPVTPEPEISRAMIRAYENPIGFP